MCQQTLKYCAPPTSIQRNYQHLLSIFDYLSNSFKEEWVEIVQMQPYEFMKRLGMVSLTLQVFQSSLRLYLEIAGLEPGWEEHKPKVRERSEGTWPKVRTKRME